MVGVTSMREPAGPGAEVWLCGPGAHLAEQDLDEKPAGSPVVTAVLAVGGSLASFLAGWEGGRE